MRRPNQVQPVAVAELLQDISAGLTPLPADMFDLYVRTMAGATGFGVQARKINPAPGNPGHFFGSVAGHRTATTTTSLATPVVFVVDDDTSVREILEGLIRSAGLEVRAFASGQEFLARPHMASPSCLVLEVSLPDLDGFELQRRIAADRCDMPVIFVTRYADIALAVKAMKAGAIDFLTKPFRDDQLLSAIAQAIELSKTAFSIEAESRSLQERYDALSCREREVMDRIVTGMLNKQVACDLGISEITVKAHRGRVMRKMQAGSFADLVRMAGNLRTRT